MGTLRPIGKGARGGPTKAPEPQQRDPETGHFLAKLPELGSAEEGDFLDRIAAGETINAQAREMAVSRRAVYLWINADPARKAAYKDAKRQSAEVHAERAGTVLEDALEDGRLDSARAQIYKARSGYEQWLAEKRDPEQFGDRATQVNVGIDLGGLFTEVLRAGPEHPVLARDRAMLTVEAEVEEESNEAAP